MLSPDRRRVLNRALRQRLGTTSIDDLETAARDAARRGDNETLGAILKRLDEITPLGGKHDRFAAFCTELESTPIGGK